MRHRSSFLLALALLAAPAGAMVLGADVACADPYPPPEERPLPRSVRLDYLPDPGVRRSCDRAEALELGISNAAKRDPIDPNAAARLIVRITRRGVVYTATAEVREEEGVTVYTSPFGPVHTCDMLLIDIGVGVGYAFRRADQAAAEKAAADKVAADKAAADKAAADKAAADKAAADKAAADKAAADKAAADKATAAAVLPSRRAPPPRRSWAWLVAASGGVGFGMAPADVAAVMSLEGGIQWPLAPNWLASVSLGGLFSPRASAPMTAQLSQTQVEVGTLLAAGVLAPCVHRHIGFGWVFGCVGLQLGGLRADGANIPQPASAVMRWAAVDPRLGVEVPLPNVPWLAARLVGDVPVLIQRPRAFVNEGPPMSTARLTEVWQAKRAVPTLSLGFRALF